MTHNNNNTLDKGGLAYDCDNCHIDLVNSFGHAVADEIINDSYGHNYCGDCYRKLNGLKRVICKCCGAEKDVSAIS